MTRSAARQALDLRVSRDYAAMSQQAADEIFEEIKRTPNLLLCASAGGTPTATYASLAAHHGRRPRLFTRLRVIQIDEWGGLPRRHAATCEADLRLKLLSPLQVARDRFVDFRSGAVEPEAECRRVARWLEVNGPIDVCILGLGLNGHIAMNEPGDFVQLCAHVANLAPSSRNHAMLKGLARKPPYGLTLGVGEILQSRRVFLLVSGSKKRNALRRLLTPEVSCSFPASFLWLHSNATIFCDREAVDGL